MAALNRRTDIAEREFLSRSVRRVIAQAARDAGDGAGLGGGAVTAAWGSITGTLSAQADLKEVTDNNEALATLADDGA